MALLWAKQTTDCQYEVRSAGQSVRLYSNGVFHSQWNPNRVFGDAIWDLLALPALPLLGEPNSDYTADLRVLVLGVGGGAVIRQLLALMGADQRGLVIEGVDLDPHHLAIARRWFGLGEFANVNLIVADAVDWVANYQGTGFDLVIDDLFGHTETNAHGEVEVSRSVPFDARWSRSLCSLLAEGGALVINNGDRAEIRTACRQLLVPQADVDDSLLTATNYGVQLSHSRYDNRVLAVFNVSANTCAAAAAGPEGISMNWRRHWRQSIEHRCQSAGLPAAQSRLALSYVKQARRVFGD